MWFTTFLEKDKVRRLANSLPTDHSFQGRLLTGNLRAAWRALPPTTRSPHGKHKRTWDLRVPVPCRRRPPTPTNNRALYFIVAAAARPGRDSSAGTCPRVHDRNREATTASTPPLSDELKSKFSEIFHLLLTYTNGSFLSRRALLTHVTQKKVVLLV